MEVEPATTGKPRKRTRASVPSTGIARRAPVQGYSIEDKLRACAAALTTNREHPYSREAIEAAKNALNAATLSKETLYSWMAKYRDRVTALLEIRQPTMEQAVLETQDKVLEMWTVARDKALSRLGRDDILDKAAARDLAVIGGITQDHIHKMHKLSAERTAKIYALLDACSRVNYDYDTLIDDMIAMVEAEVNHPPLFINTHAENSTDTPNREDNG